MGVIKAVHGAVGSVLEEQWKEFFQCDALSDDTLLVQAHKRIGPRSANNRKDDDYLSNGSILCVADGQCVLVVKQGKIIDFCRTPGEHIFEDPEQSGFKGFFREVGKRVAFGGGDIQPTVYRVYYMNVKEITGNPFRTPEPIPFRVRDRESTMDLDSDVLLGGLFSYRVSDPVKLYKTIIGNVKGRFSRRELSGHLQAELITHLQPALARLSELGLRPAQIPEHVQELSDSLRREMNKGWCGEHGIELGDLALDSFSVNDLELIQSVQHANILKDPEMAAAALAQTNSEALSAAAVNSAAVRAIPVAAVNPQPKDTAWTCSCGTVSYRRFCPECGKPRPTD